MIEQIQIAPHEDAADSVGTVPDRKPGPICDRPTTGTFHRSYPRPASLSAASIISMGQDMTGGFALPQSPLQTGHP